jgi:hypothetical protein
VKSIDARYLAKVQKGTPEDCWPWTAARTPKGYGLFRDEFGVLRSATRWAYERFIGPIADDMDLCHTCDNPPCHNPKHWWIGSRSENLSDMYAKGRGTRPLLVGENHANSKLTNAQRAEIQRRRPTTTLRSLADEYGVSLPTIDRVSRSPHRY